MTLVLVLACIATAALVVEHVIISIYALHGASPEERPKIILALATMFRFSGRKSRR